jgi:PadR family transcriptional regulator PadR
MKGTHIGELEEVILLAVGILYDEAYGVAIKKELEKRLGRKLSVGALHSALKRLEKKGFLNSRLGEATSERGGKRKRFFKVTIHGYRALNAVKETRQDLWNSVPPIAFDFK